MASPLYNSRGTWSATVQYNYLDSVQYGKYTYVFTADDGSLNQNPSQNAVWVQMPVVTQEDQFYLRSREDLLQYEDARYQSLINAMANFYTMRNDQSIWGSFLRAVAMELARIEYMYSYDVVAKNPQFLTPPDIKREYADPLFITGNFQQTGQFDSGDFGASFNQWVGDVGTIARTAIIDSNGNIQIATTAGATGTQEPSWALFPGQTTQDGSVIWTNAGPAPATLAYPIGYRDMLVDLLAAYQEGATPKSIQDVIYAYTGKQIIVEELYKQIVPGGFYDQSDRNAVKVSVNVGGSDPLTDVESLTELQQITNSLYGAIDLAKPAHVGLEFTTVFGADENIDCFISPRFLTAYQLNTLTNKQKVYYELIAYVLTQTTVLGWTPQTAFPVGSIIQDIHGNIQLTVAGGVSGVSTPTWNQSLQGTTTETNVLSPPTTLTWINIGTPQISIAAYNALPTYQQPNYQGYYQNLNCTGSGIDDVLRIIIQQYEEPPFDPMLYQAPIFDPANPTTTLASYGRRLLSPISAANWTSLQGPPQVWNNSTVYSKGTLVRGVPAAASGSFNSGTWTPGGWQLYRALKKTSGHQPVSNTAYWTQLPSPSIYQAYYRASNGQYVTGIRQWAQNTQFYTGQLMIDNNGNLQLAAIVANTSSPPTPGFGTTSPVFNLVGTPNAWQISNNVLTVAVNGSVVNMGLVAGVSTVTLLNFTFATFLNGLTLPVVAVDTSMNVIRMTFVHANQSSGITDESSATVRVGFSTSTAVPTYDGQITWEYLGLNYLNDPAKWIQVVDSNNSVTGEVANWDVTHQMGLLAPRTDLVWEIGGGDMFNSYEME